MSWKTTKTASITNRPAWMVGGSGLSVGQSPAIKRWIQIQADGRSKDRHTIFRVNQLGGIGGGYKNSMFGPTADGVHQQRGRIVSKLYCNMGGYNCCNCTSPGCEPCINTASPLPTSGTAYVMETAPKHYHIISSKGALYAAFTASAYKAVLPKSGQRVFSMSCNEAHEYFPGACSTWSELDGLPPNSIFWSTQPGKTSTIWNNYGVGVGTNEINIPL